VLTSDQKGSIAETAIVAAAAKLGIGVFKPLTDGERYDLIFDLRPHLMRVQCKWACMRGEVVIVRCVSARRAADGVRRRTYTAEEIDAFAAYCSGTDTCYFLPIDAFPSHRAIQLRLRAARNNQRLGINWASDFEFAARLGRSGAVAQLGERLAGSQ
jgi:hypothetical protein